MKWIERTLKPKHNNLDRPELADRILNFNCGAHVTQCGSRFGKIGFVLRSYKVGQDPRGSDGSNRLNG